MAAPCDEESSAVLSAVLEAAVKDKMGDDDVVLRVSKRLFSPDFRAYMDSFIDKHCKSFASLSDDELSEGKVTEFASSHYETYQNFIRRFESKLDEYLASEGTTAEQLMEAIAKRRGEGTTMEDNGKLFLDLLQSTTDFMSFVEWMREEAEDASSSDS